VYYTLVLQVACAVQVRSDQLMCHPVIAAVKYEILLSVRMVKNNWSAVLRGAGIAQSV